MRTNRSLLNVAVDSAHLRNVLPATAHSSHLTQLEMDQRQCFEFDTLRRVSALIACLFSLDMCKDYKRTTDRSCVQLPTSAVNVTLPAFAAERCAAATLPPNAGACYRSIYLAQRALSSKPAARRCQSMGQTDGWTLDRFIDPAQHTSSVIKYSSMVLEAIAVNASDTVLLLGRIAANPPHARSI